MSLTSQIDSPRSLFMRFSARSIPNSSAVTAVRDGAYRSAIKRDVGEAGVDTAWARLIGAVIDFRLRRAFTTANLVPPTAQRGHAALTRRHPDAAPLLAGLTGAIGGVFAAAGPMDDSRIELPGRTENDLIRLCVVAGQLDRLYRNYESTTSVLSQGGVAGSRGVHGPSRPRWAGRSPEGGQGFGARTPREEGRQRTRNPAVMPGFSAVRFMCWISGCCMHSEYV